MPALSKSKYNGAQLFLFCVLSLLTGLLILPVIWLVSASVQGPGQIFASPFQWLPAKLDLVNYSDAWTQGKLRTAFASSTVTALIAVTVHVAFSTIVGYVLAQYEFRFKTAIVYLFLLTIMIPQQVTFFTVYDITKQLGLINTQLGIALPFFLNGAGVFLMIQFAKYIPKELLEAAKIDGSTNWGTFFRISLPQMKSGISALTILMFTFIWDEFAWSRLVVNSDEVRTLPLALTLFLQQSDNSSNIPAMMAGCVISFLPVLTVFLLFQRQFIESISHTGIKG